MPLAPILLAGRGLSGQREPTKLRTGDLSTAYNLDFSVQGLVQKDFGSLAVGSAISGAPSIVAGSEYFADASTQRRVIATANGKLYKDDMTGAFATTLKSGLTANRQVHIAAGGAESVGRSRKMFFLNGVDPVQVITADGATTHDLGTPPADWTGAHQPSFMVPFRGFKIAGGVDNNVDLLYGSDSTDDEKWTTATPGSILAMPVYPGEGRRMVAAIAALGRLIVVKWPNGIYWVDDDASTITGWIAKPLSRELGGAPTPWCVTQIEDATIALLTDSGHVVLIEETYGAVSGMVPVDLTKELNLLDVMRTEFNLGRLQFAQLLWYKELKQLHVLLAGFGSTREDRRLVIDFSGQRPRAEITKKDVNESIWLELDSQNIPRPRIGSDVGVVRKIDQLARSTDGAPYPFQLQTALTDFSDTNASYAGKKAFYRLHLEFVPTGAYDVACDVIVDGRTKGTVVFSQGSTGATLPFTLPGILGGYELRRRSRDIAGEGYTMSLRFTENGPNNPQLARAWVEFENLGMAP